MDDIITNRPNETKQIKRNTVQVNNKGNQDTYIITNT